MVVLGLGVVVVGLFSPRGIVVDRFVIHQASLASLSTGSGTLSKMAISTSSCFM